MNNSVSIEQIILGLKSYLGSIIGTTDLRSLGVIAFGNTFIESKVPYFLIPLANDKKELDLDIIKKNVLEQMEHLPEKKIVIPVPFIGAKLTLDSKAITDIYDIIKAQ